MKQAPESAPEVDARECSCCNVVILHPEWEKDGKTRRELVGEDQRVKEDLRFLEKSRNEAKTLNMERDV